MRVIYMIFLFIFLHTWQCMNRNHEVLVCKEHKLKMASWVSAEIKLFLIYPIKRLLLGDTTLCRGKSTGIRVKPWKTKKNLNRIEHLIMLQVQG